eukprot:8578088-Pyramimonas_sp.AAC.1
MSTKTEQESSIRSKCSARAHTKCSRGGQRCGPVVTVETIQRLSGAKEGVMPALEKLFEEVTS